MLKDYEQEVAIERHNNEYWNDYNAKSYKRELNALQDQVRQKDEELSTLRKNVSEIINTLGDKFKGLYQDVKDYFKGHKDNLAMAVSMWFGDVWNNMRDGKDREEYKADRSQGRMLINEMSVTDWRANKERMRLAEEERMRQERQ